MSEALTCPACDGVGANQHIDESAEARKAKERREAMRKRLDCREENDEKPGAALSGAYSFTHAPMTKDLLPPQAEIASRIESHRQACEEAEANFATHDAATLVAQIKRDLEETGRSEVLKRAAEGDPEAYAAAQMVADQVRRESAVEMHDDAHYRALGSYQPLLVTANWAERGKWPARYVYRLAESVAMIARAFLKGNPRRDIRKAIDLLSSVVDEMGAQ